MHSLLRVIVASVGILVLPGALVGLAKAQDGPVQKGSWHFEKDSRDQPSLAYLRDDKVAFDIGVGRAVGLWIAYPGRRRPDSNTTITIQTSSKNWTM
jgi:hypothetical protein